MMFHTASRAALPLLLIYQKFEFTPIILRDLYGCGGGGDGVSITFIFLLLNEFSDHVRGCIRCVSNPPEDFQDVLCRSKTIFAGETRPSRGTRLRLVNDFSLHHPKPIKMNSSIDLVLEENCRCGFFEKGMKRLMNSSEEAKKKMNTILTEIILSDAGNKSVTIFGLPLLPLPTTPGKLSVGPELLIIDQSPKQLNFKSLRVKCDAVEG